MDKLLTARQRRFAEQYLLSGDARQSALAAGYSPSVAAGKTARLLQNRDVADYLERRRAEIAQNEVDTRRVMAELSSIAFADAGDYWRVEDGRLLVADTGGLSPGKRAAVAQVREGTKGVEVKLYDKMRALELLGKASGMFSDRAAEEAVEKAFEVEIRVVE